MKWHDRLIHSIVVLMLGCTLVAAAQNEYLEVEIKPEDMSYPVERFHQRLDNAAVLMTDSLLNGYVRSVALRVLAADTLIEPDSISVFLMNRSILNAFSLFDGKIYLSLPILGVMNCEDHLAFLIAHEIAHVKKAHLKQEWDEELSNGYILPPQVLLHEIGDIFVSEINVARNTLDFTVSNRRIERIDSLPVSATNFVLVSEQGNSYEGQLYAITFKDHITVLYYLAERSLYSENAAADFRQMISSMSLAKKQYRYCTGTAKTSLTIP